MHDSVFLYIRGSVMKRLLIVVVLLLAGCSGFRGDMHWEMPAFQYTDQSGETVTLDNLAGTPFIAYMYFTNCTTVCPPMTMHMVDVQQAIQQAGIERYAIVGFSVDPVRDQPHVIDTYIKQFPVVDLTKWHLLTGYEEADMTRFAAKAFKAIVKAGDDGQMIHATNFYLVDQAGVVRKTYDGYSNVPYQDIVSDLKNVQPK